MPSIELGAEARRKRALNCCACVRSLTQSPLAVIHSPGEIVAAWPTTVVRSRCPRALTRSTQKPVSALWKVTRSTAPASTSRSGGFEVCGAAIAYSGGAEECGEQQGQGVSKLGQWRE